tara:strand:+ start:1398 stop:1568 length:171 start_codon:yes stop_codon:yes gene_type:complete
MLGKRPCRHKYVKPILSLDEGISQCGNDGKFRRFICLETTQIRGQFQSTQKRMCAK